MNISPTSLSNASSTSSLNEETQQKQAGKKNRKKKDKAPSGVRQVNTQQSEVGRTQQNVGSSSLRTEGKQLNSTTTQVFSNQGETIVDLNSRLSPDDSSNNSKEGASAEGTPSIDTLSVNEASINSSQTGQTSPLQSKDSNSDNVEWDFNALLAAIKENNIKAFQEQLAIVAPLKQENILAICRIAIEAENLVKAAEEQNNSKCLSELYKFFLKVVSRDNAISSQMCPQNFRHLTQGLFILTVHLYPVSEEFKLLNSDIQALEKFAAFLKKLPDNLREVAVKSIEEHFAAIYPLTLSVQMAATLPSSESDSTYAELWEQLSWWATAPEGVLNSKDEARGKLHAIMSHFDNLYLQKMSPLKDDLPLENNAPPLPSETAPKTVNDPKAPVGAPKTNAKNSTVTAPKALVAVPKTVTTPKTSATNNTVTALKAPVGAPKAPVALPKIVTAHQTSGSINTGARFQDNRSGTSTGLNTNGSKPPSRFQDSRSGASTRFNTNGRR